MTEEKKVPIGMLPPDQAIKRMVEENFEELVARVAKIERTLDIMFGSYHGELFKQMEAAFHNWNGTTREEIIKREKETKGFSKDLDKHFFRKLLGYK